MPGKKIDGTILAKWIIHVPFVQTIQLLIMPLPGYFDEHPFGWACACITGMLRKISAH